MGKRITNLPSQPALTSGDYLVIDGLGGTRKVKVDNVLVDTGTEPPSEHTGVSGCMYVQYVGDEVVGVFFKTADGWEMPPMGGSYFKQFTPKEGVTSHSTITITGGLKPDDSE